MRAARRCAERCCYQRNHQPGECRWLCAVAVDEDWSIVELRYTRTGNATATVIRRAQWSPGGHYASGWSEKVFTLQFNTPDSGTATCSDTSKTGTPMMHHGTFTLK